MALTVTKVAIYVIIGISLYFLIKKLFPLKEKPQPKKLKLTKKNTRLLEIISMILAALFLAYVYFNIKNIPFYLRKIFIYSETLPLIIEYDQTLAGGAIGLLSIAIMLLIILTPLKIVHGSELKNYLRYYNNKEQIDGYKLFKLANIFMIIFLIAGLVSFTFGIDNYVIANEEDIYYNPLWSLGDVQKYSWSDIDKIIYTSVVTGKDNQLHKLESPKYHILMKSGESLPNFIGVSEEKIQEWIMLTQKKSGVQVYEQQGDELRLIE